MSNDYVTRLLVDQRVSEFRHEADQERLARLARGGRGTTRHWWQRLTLFHTRPSVQEPTHAAGQPAGELVAADGRC
jgi:hypothetical protein